MSELFNRAIVMVNQAVTAQQQQQYLEADQKYQGAYQLLSSAIQFQKQLLPAERAKLENYAEKIVQQRRALQVYLVSNNSNGMAQATASSSSSTAGAGKGKSEEEEISPTAGGEWDSSWDALLPKVQKKNPTQHVDPTPAASKKDAGIGPAPSKQENPAAGPAGNSSKNANKIDAPPPPPPASIGGKPPSLGGLDHLVGMGGGALKPSGYAPRASDLVLKAIEIATKLIVAKDLKRAIDVLQHAMDVGSRESHLPSNFAELRSMCVQLRQKYVKENPPRLLQDNPILSEELELLRKSGYTSQMLLPMWDSVDEGFVAENLYCPCDGIYKDSFVPKLCKEQMELKAVFSRLVPFTAVKEAQPVVVAPTPSSPSDSGSIPNADGTPAPGGEGPKNNDGIGAVAAPNSSDPSAAAPSPIVTPTATTATPELYVLKSPDPNHIRQTVVGDCSLVCSLIVSAAYEQRFPNTRLISSALYPQDPVTRRPVLNPKGKYFVKMLLNGCTRLVAIDDRLPLEPLPARITTPEEEAKYLTERGSQRQVFASYSSEPNELWVSLLEKAFIKVFGGSYDFPGSTSSHDLYMLSGWLPEVIPLDGSRRNRNSNPDGNRDCLSHAEQWARVVGSYQKGMVVATMNTPGDLAPIVQQKLGLVSGHAYAILDFREVHGYKLVKVKNPWSNKNAWNGLFSLRDERRCTADMMQALQFSQAEADQGIFWVTWEDATTYFRFLHLSWNPFTLFTSPSGGLRKPTRIAVHTVIPLHPAFSEVPQLHIRVPACAAPNVGEGGGRRLHLLLARHVIDHREYQVRADNDADDDTPPANGYQPPYITAHIFDITEFPSAVAQLAASPVSTCHGTSTCCTARRISHGELPKSATIHHGVYRDTVLQTVSWTAPAGGTHEYVAVLARHPKDLQRRGSEPEIRITATLHTAYPVGNNPSQEATMHLMPNHCLSTVKAVSGEWRKGSSCGGPYGSQTFGLNPQYALSLTKPSRVLIRLTSRTMSDTPLRVFFIRRAVRKNDAKLPWNARMNYLSSDLVTHVFASPSYCMDESSVDTSIRAHFCFGERPGPEKNSCSSSPKANEEEDVALFPPKTISCKMVKFPSSNAPVQLHLPPQLPQFKTATFGDVICALLVSQGYLASSSRTKVIFQGNQVPMQSSFDPWQPAVKEMNVILGTEEAQRTMEIMACERKLYSDIGPKLIQLLNIVAATNTNASDDVRKLLLLIEEMTTQLLLELDACSCATDAVREGRRCVVEGTNAIHKMLDLVKSFPSKSSSSSSASNANHQAAADFFTSYPEVPEGDYTIVPVCLKRGVPGAFKLHVEAETPFDLSEVVVEGHNWSHVQTVQGNWNSGDVCGSISIMVATASSASVYCRLLALPVSGEDHTKDPKGSIVIVDAATEKTVIARTNGAYAGATLGPFELQGKVKYKAILGLEKFASHQPKFLLKVYSTVALQATCTSP